MTSPLRTIPVAVVASVFVLGVAPASAQTPALAGGACRDSTADSSYHHCALWVDGTRVRRGMHGDVVARPGFLHPARLTRVVAGDSARVYAARYETNAWRAGALQFASTVLLVSAWVIAQTQNCGYPFEACSSADDDQLIAAGLLTLGGAATGVASVLLTFRAARAMGRAVWWHNARFAR